MVQLEGVVGFCPVCRLCSACAIQADVCGRLKPPSSTTRHTCCRIAVQPSQGTASSRRCFLCPRRSVSRYGRQACFHCCSCKSMREQALKVLHFACYSRLQRRELLMRQTELSMHETILDTLVVKFTPLQTHDALRQSVHSHWTGAASGFRSSLSWLSSSISLPCACSTASCFIVSGY